MTPDEINIAIAEACGWEEVNNNYNHGEFYPGGIIAGYHKNESYVRAIPSYCTDLNAMHEAEKLLDDEQLADMAEHLGVNAEDMRPMDAWNTLLRATARQRAEAFLRTIGKWKD